MPAPELDPALVARLLRIGGHDLLVQLIDSFAADAPARRTALTAAHAGRDLPALAAAAHTLVAGAGQLGASALSADARTLEETARRGDAGGAAALLPPLLERFTAALDALAELRGPA